ncbi:cupin domain-containing protein [Streptomyces sp. NBC_00280]|uniref:cupin domain-containing protein n=1 Tax=Streptomyces sp. NBC_00280 TaxID=2975699 RepID=UPI00324C16E9
MRTIHRFTLAGAAAFSLALLPGPANATPSSGVSATVLAQTSAGGKDYILREITIQPGGSTGWHYHDGTLYGVVKQGTLTRTESDCTTNHTHNAGSTIVEPSGADHVHIGRNLGTTSVVLDVFYVNPAGSPLAEDAANPGCTFQ